MLEGGEKGPARTAPHSSRRARLEARELGAGIIQEAAGREGKCESSFTDKMPPNTHISPVPPPTTPPPNSHVLTIRL